MGWIIDRARPHPLYNADDEKQKVFYYKYLFKLNTTSFLGKTKGNLITKTLCMMGIFSCFCCRLLTLKLFQIKIFL